MNWTLHVFKSPPVIRVKLRGEFKLAETRRLLDVVGNEMDDLRFTPVVFDVRELNVGEIAVPELIEMLNMFLSETMVFACRKIAILTSKPPRMSFAATLKKIAQPGSPAVMTVFQSEREALSWVSEYY